MSREEITIDFWKEITALPGAELVSNTLSIWENPGPSLHGYLAGSLTTGACVLSEGSGEPEDSGSQVL